MPRLIYIFLFWTLVLCLPLYGSAQSSMVQIDGITLEGNKKTKDYIILRELDFEPGDSILLEDLMTVLERNEIYLMNTGLFGSAQVNVSEWNDTKVNVHIKVLESWYIYTIPVFSLADRNFNEWWVEQNHSLKRVNYGVNLYWDNVTGQNDDLIVFLEGGYSQIFSAEYLSKRIDKERTLAFHGNVWFERQREVNFMSDSNKLVRAQNDAFSSRAFESFLALNHRPALRFEQSIGLQYNQDWIRDTIAELNPDYFLDGRTGLQYFSAFYLAEWNNTDFEPYPMNGNFLEFEVRKSGLGITKDINDFSFFAQYKHFVTANSWLSFEFDQKIKQSLSKRKQPYYLQQALGYEEDFLRGYEYYVIDGQDYFYVKNSIRFKFIDREFNLGKLMPFDAFKIVPAKALFTLNSDFGAVSDNYFAAGNHLSNEFLWGGGAGLDLVLYYNKVFRFEYNVNQLGEHGFFIRFVLN